MPGNTWTIPYPTLSAYARSKRRVGHVLMCQVVPGAAAAMHGCTLFAHDLRPGAQTKVC